MPNNNLCLKAAHVRLPIEINAFEWQGV